MRYRTNRGFTLIELLVVLVILGLLAGLVGPRDIKHLRDSNTKTAILQIEELIGPLVLYRLEVGRYPTSDQGVTALNENPPDAEQWNVPYLSKKTIRKDPWGYDYHYKFPGEHGAFDLYSLGADNSSGGEGEDRDVLGWE